MKYFLFIVLLLFSFLTSWSQSSSQNITLQFLPYMGATPMVLGETTALSNGTPYMITRAQFYVSGIQLIHDGGQILSIPDVHLLVNANNSDGYSIGQHPIETVEAIHFNIGIEATLNHEDPTLYPAEHPLALQNPSMHWGWAAGYTFIALEGDAADGTSSFSYHAIGDEFLTTVELPMVGTASENGLTATIYTNYAYLMNGLSLSGVVHGGGHNIGTLMMNINKYGVFSSEVPTAITAYPNAVTDFIAPNPFEGNTVLSYQHPTAQYLDLIIVDITGRTVGQYGHLPAIGKIDLSLPTSSIYTYLLYDQNHQLVGKGQMLGIE